MFADLNAIVASRAVDQVLIIDVDRNMMDVQPSTALACSATVHIAAVVLTL